MIKQQNSIFKFQIFSFIFVSILGTLLHFSYEWSNNNFFVSLFSAVNESTWEHLKLVFFPMLITTLIGSLIFQKDIPSFLCAKTIGIIVAICFIITFFYTYTGIIGRNFAFLDIASFFIAIFLGEFIAYKIMIFNPDCNTKLFLIILIFLLFCFVFFTYFTPKIALFKDPISGNYGI